jgi:hypothetical protein
MQSKTLKLKKARLLPLVFYNQKNTKENVELSSTLYPHLHNMGITVF